MWAGVRALRTPCLVLPIVTNTIHNVQWSALDYRLPDGSVPIRRWLMSLRDRQARARIVARLQRLRSGGFGDCRPMRAGVWELRVDDGPGYRVYYARAGDRVVLLLAGGDKRTESVDVERAVHYWIDWQRRTS